jgi:hypothetical protein
MKDDAMKKFNDWLATTPLGTAFKVFIALFTAAMVQAWVTDSTISLDKWQTWVIGAAAVALVPVWNWLNPADVRYGRGSNEDGQ